jgi:hypothetical protein
VLVRDIMQEISELRVADFKQIERATVADVFKLFTQRRLTHVPVMETGEAGEQRLRGLLSAAKVKRLLSTPGTQHRYRTKTSPEVATN